MVSIKFKTHACKFSLYFLSIFQAQGLSKNQSVAPQELLLYVYATLHPFVQAAMKNVRRRHSALGRLGSTEGFADSELDSELPSYLIDEESSDDEMCVVSAKHVSKKFKKGNDVTGFKANTWLPGEVSAVSSRKKVLEERDRENRELHKVYDGASAPKLSGFNRQASMREDKGSKYYFSTIFRFVKLIILYRWWC